MLNTSVMLDEVGFIEQVVLCVFALQTTGVGSGREGDSIPRPVQSHLDGGQEPKRTSPCLELCQKELGQTG